MVGTKDPPDSLSSRASCGGASPSRRVGFVVADRASSSDPPRPIQHPDERLVATEAPGMVRKLAYGEVRLLLAGTRPAEGNAPDLHHRQPPTGKIGPAPHLTPFRFRRGQEALLSSHSLLRSTPKDSKLLPINTRYAARSCSVRHPEYQSAPTSFRAPSLPGGFCEQL